MATTKKIHVYDQETFEIGGRRFTVTAWPTTQGLDLQSRLTTDLGSTGHPSPGLIKEVVKGVSVDNIAIVSDDIYNRTFSRRYGELMELFDSILKFNFGEDEVIVEEGVSDEGTADPKEQDVTSE